MDITRNHWITSARTARGLALCVAVGISACKSSNPTDPEVTPGSITVTVSTSGASIDADGYTVTANGTPTAIAVDGSATFSALDPADYAVELSGLAANCAVTGTNPVTATVLEAQAAPVAFAVTCTRILGPVTLVGADAVGDIYTVDESTGAGTLFLDTSTDSVGGSLGEVGPVSSMSYIPTTDAWWLGTGGKASCDGCIQTLDVATGVATTLYHRPSTWGFSGLAVHPSNDKIYTFESDGSSRLYEIDPVTGVDTEIHNTLSVRSAGKGTTFSLAEVLYVVGDGDLFSVDEVAGTYALIGTVTFTGFPALHSTDIQSMATRPSDGVIFAIVRDGGRRSHTATYLSTLNVATGEATFVGQTVDLMDGLAFVPTTFIVP